MQSVQRLRYGLHGPGFETRQRKNTFLHNVQTGSGASRPYLIFSGYWDLCRGKAAGALTTRLHLVPKLRMNGTIRLLPHTPSWRGQGNLHPCLQAAEGTVRRDFALCQVLPKFNMRFYFFLNTVIVCISFPMRLKTAVVCLRVFRDSQRCS